MNGSDASYIGVMSGTSLDALDVVVADLSTPLPKLLATQAFELSVELRQKILDLCLPGIDEINRTGWLDRELGHWIGHCINELLGNSGISKDTIIAIGSHGQTVRHSPLDIADNKAAFTLQIGDPNTIAELTGITTVADFRRRDIAAGGQGAPLVPAFHQAVFQCPDRQRVICNIGGMANITLLPPITTEVSGFDTGPGNVLMDYWIHQQRSSLFDKNGSWAASGTCHQALLTSLMSEPYLALAPPKSTGRELFNHQWLQAQLQSHPDIDAADIQATLCHFTARSIAEHIQRYANSCDEVIVCGGGALNQYLMAVLQDYLGNTPVMTSAEVGVDPQWIEATAFAWLAKQTLSQLPGNCPAVTGANRPVILGGVYIA